MVRAHVWLRTLSLDLTHALTITYTETRPWQICYTEPFVQCLPHIVTDSLTHTQKLVHECMHGSSRLIGCQLLFGWGSVRRWPDGSQGWWLSGVLLWSMGCINTAHTHTHTVAYTRINKNAMHAHRREIIFRHMYAREVTHTHTNAHHLPSQRIPRATV